MPTNITKEDVQRLMEEGAQLVEVLPGAINIPLKSLNRETTAHLERGRPVIVY